MFLPCFDIELGYMLAKQTFIVMLYPVGILFVISQWSSVFIGKVCTNKQPACICKYKNTQHKKKNMEKDF